MPPPDCTAGELIVQLNPPPDIQYSGFIGKIRCSLQSIPMMQCEERQILMSQKILPYLNPFKIVPVSVLIDTSDLMQALIGWPAEVDGDMTDFSKCSSTSMESSSLRLVRTPLPLSLSTAPPFTKKKSVKEIQ